MMFLRALFGSHQRTPDSELSDVNPHMTSGFRELKLTPRRRINTLSKTRIIPTFRLLKGRGDYALVMNGHSDWSLVLPKYKACSRTNPAKQLLENTYQAAIGGSARAAAGAQEAAHEPSLANAACERRAYQTPHLEPSTTIC
ncbi:unnamed protein product [Pieris brassicae]|uniref:Uncharacterized protein n=1 Tax=Pieris brassicae TaxID=7116 RepID=A0A9P0T1S3_PIEBR|nr:unnamed protein product [Pieris brassicae]